MQRCDQATDVKLTLKAQEPEEMKGLQQIGNEQASGGERYGVNCEGDAASITRGQSGSPSQRLQPLHEENVDDGKRSVSGLLSTLPLAGNLMTPLLTVIPPLTRVV